MQIRLEEIFNKTDFTTALKTVFDKLEPAKAMFGASGAANVSGLFEDATSLVAFDMTFATGFKISDLKDFFSNGSSSTSIGTLFLRIDDMGIFAEASLDEISLDLFTDIGITNGDFLISTGTRLDAPFEASVNSTGSLANGIGFSNTIKSRLDFVPYGQLFASLPFTAEVNGYDQKLKVLIQDSNLFDDEQVIVKVDFDACQVVTLLDGMMAKLGSLTISPRSILGPASMGVDFVKSLDDLFPDTEKSLDDFFPDAAQFVEGVLEG